MPKIHEIIIIGGGLAGASAAFHLAKAGRSVLLLEKEAEPHDKVCGEFLGHEALPLLREIDVDPIRLGAKQLDIVQIHSRHFQVELRNSIQALGISRRRLDEACLKSAEEQGVQVQRGSAVTGFQTTSDFFEVECGQKIIRAKALFLATGKHELKGVEPRRGREKSAIGFKMHLRLPQNLQKKWRKKLGMFFFQGGYGGFCPIEEDLFSFCWIIEKQIYKKLQDFPKVLEYFHSQNPQLHMALEKAMWAWPKPLAVANVPYGYVQSSQASSIKNLYRLGDQFAVIPSLTGSGMTLALFTARAAARDYLTPTSSNYVETCAAFIRTRMKWAYPLHRLCQSPLLADLALGALKFFPKWASQLGKNLHPREDFL